MNFDINIEKLPFGKIIVTDYSNDYDEYVASEIVDFTDIEEPFKYEETVSLNTILQMSGNDAILLDVLMNEHNYNEDLGVYEPDQFEFVAKRDGYYTITHFIIPNEQWMANTFPEVKDRYTSDDPNLNGGIYYITSEGKLMKHWCTPGTDTWETTEASVKELLEANLSNYPIISCKIDVFYTGYLQECYINYCREYFSKLMQNCRPTCEPNNVSDIKYARDFLWMTLNVMDYLCLFGQYMEALRILEQINYCGGFCKNVIQDGNSCCQTHTFNRCGCSQA